MRLHNTHMKTAYTGAYADVDYISCTSCHGAPQCGGLQQRLLTFSIHKWHAILNVVLI